MRVSVGWIKNVAVLVEPRGAHRTRAFVDLRGGPGADDRNANGRMRERPREGDLHARPLTHLCNATDAVQQLERMAAARLLQKRYSAPQISAAEHCIARVLPGKQTVCQHVVA